MILQVRCSGNRELNLAGSKPDPVVGM